MAVKGMPAKRLFEWMAAGLTASGGEGGDKLKVAREMAYPSHPEHYALPPYPGVNETLGGQPTRVHVIPTGDLPPFVQAAVDPSYEIRSPSRVELDDGTVFGWILHQFRDSGNDCEGILRVWWPAEAPEVFFEEHAQHFSVEFRALFLLGAQALEEGDSSPQPTATAP
ncbi:hypothetical protein WCE04_05945 [Pseudomonas shirazica]|uniref:hypothetical protein n=1 Tax=Pseudomonas shirazica TaxID=1940636 RepID=UPI0034D6113A